MRLDRGVLPSDCQEIRTRKASGMELKRQESGNNILIIGILLLIHSIVSLPAFSVKKLSIFDDKL
jgi:hypothetical protein